MLCEGYAVCKSFQASYQAGTDECSGCRGDIRPLRAVTGAIDKGLDPVINQVLYNTPAEIAPRLEDAVAQVKEDLQRTNDGDPFTDGQVLVTIIYRLMQRVAHLSDAVRIAARNASG